MKIILSAMFVLASINFLNAQNFDWANASGSTLNDEAISVAVDASGNVYMTGYFAGSVDFDPGADVDMHTANGEYDIFIRKLDSSGNFLWAHSFGGSLNDIGQDVFIDGTGNVYLTGSFQETIDFDPSAANANATSAGGTDVFILELDTDGNFVRILVFGGTGYESGNAIALDPQGNIYTTGDFYGTVDLNPGVDSDEHITNGIYDVFMQKLSNTGDFIWGKTFGGIGLDFSNSINVDVDGSVYATGTFEGNVDFDPDALINTMTSNGEYDVYIQKLSGDGDFVWAKTFGGTESDFGRSYLDQSGNLLTTGYFIDTVDFDPGTGTNMVSVNDGIDIYIQKLNDAGEFVWVNSFGGTSDVIPAGLGFNASGDIYLNGYFDGTIDFDPGSGTFNLSAGPSGAMFVQKLNASGSFQWAVTFGDDTEPIVRDIAIDNIGNIITVGGFYGTADFDPGVGTSNLTSQAESDIFVQKMNPIILDVEKIHSQSNINIYPNPANGNLHISFDEMQSEARFELLDTQGKVILDQTNYGLKEINLMLKEESGIYILRITSPEGCINNMILNQ